MKKITLSLTIFLALLLQIAFAQNSDTLLIEPIYNGSMLGAINKQIKNDTTSNGDRKHKVYKLKAGEYYYLSNAITAEFDLNIVGEKADPTDPVKFPPVLTSGTKDNGDLSAKAAINSKGDKTVIKDIYFMGFTQKGTSMTNFISITKDESDALIHNCYFEGSAMFTVKIIGNLVNLDFQNNHMRNVFANGGWYNGRGVWFENVVPEKALIRNNTFMNLNSYAFVIKGDGAAKEVIFDHNTVYNIATNPIRVWRATNMTITNNIIYNGQFLGSTQTEKENNWNDLDMQDAAIFSTALLPDDWATTYTDYPDIKDITEADRTVNIQNNAVVWHDDIHALWGDMDETFARTVVMNERTQGMFDDDAKYPNLSIENTWEDNPVFNNAPDMEGASALFTKVRTDKAGMRWGWGHFEMSGVELLYAVNWPLPENLKYSNTTYKTGSTTGGPIGDLNWFDGATGFNDNNYNGNAGNALSLNCYPNPLSSTATIEFEVVENASVSVVVYNSIGQVVNTLASNQSFAKGKQSITWNGTNSAGNELTNGLYFISVNNGSSKANKRIVILK